MWHQIIHHPWAVVIAALIHLLLLAFFVINVDWHREVSDTAIAVEAEMVGDPKRIAEIQKQMQHSPPSPEQLLEKQRLEEARQKEEAQRLEEEQKRLAELKQREEQEKAQQRQAMLRQQEEEKRLAKIKQEALILAKEKKIAEQKMLEEKKAAEQKILEEKKRQQAIEQEKQRQAELKRKKEAEKEKQHQVELKRKKEAEKEKQHQVELKRKKEAEQKRLSEEKHRKAEEKRLLQAEMQAESARLAGAMEAEEAAMSAARRGSMIKQWENAIRLRVRSKWLEPPGGASGKCKVEVTQARTGTVLDVHVVPSTSCDASMQDSVLRAVKRADPLPRPKDPSIFDSQIHFTFDPEQ